MNTPSISNAGSPLELCAAPTVPSISKILGTTLTLPGEPKDLYEQSLDSLIRELDAKTVLQVYIAEKIHDCLWWIRRYEEQKRATIITEMAAITACKKSSNVSKYEALIRKALVTNTSSKTVNKLISDVNHTMESLRQLAFDKKASVIRKLDDQIALQMKMIASLQASYEAAFNRKTHIERLTLQNDL